MKTFNKDNLAGQPETSPRLSNLINGKEPLVSTATHYNDNSRHINIGERKRWNESLQGAKDYTDYQFMNIIGQFNFDDNSKTIAEILKKEIDDRTEAIKKESEERKTAIEKEAKARLEGDRAEREAWMEAIANERDERVRQITTIVNNLQTGSLSPTRINGVRITLGPTPPETMDPRGEVYINEEGVGIVEYGGKTTNLYTRYK